MALEGGEELTSQTWALCVLPHVHGWGPKFPVHESTLNSKVFSDTIRRSIEQTVEAHPLVRQGLKT